MGPPAQARSQRGWHAIDDWPERVPVTRDELDVLETWFGDVLDELLGPSQPPLHLVHWNTFFLVLHSPTE